MALSKVAAKVVEATGKDNYNVLVNNGKESGQEVRPKCFKNASVSTSSLILAHPPRWQVPHVHFHIIPRAEGDYTQGWAKSIENTRDATANPKPEKLPDEGEFTGDLAAMRNKIRG